MTAKIDTQALRNALRRRQLAIDTAFTDIDAPEKQIEAEAEILDAAPALLDAAEELRSLRAELDVSRSVGSNLYQGAEAVMAERDALKAEVAKAYANAAYHADMAQKLKAEVERLREALQELGEAADDFWKFNWFTPNQNTPNYARVERLKAGIAAALRPASDGEVQP